MKQAEDTSIWKRSKEKLSSQLRKKWMRLLLVLIFLPFVLFLLLNLLFPLPSIQRDYSVTITSADGKLLHGFLTPDHKWRIQAGLNEITPDLKKTFIFKEDKYFRWHPGPVP